MEVSKLESLLQQSKSLHFVGTGAVAVVWRLVDGNDNIRMIHYTFLYTDIIDEKTNQIINTYRVQSPLFIQTYASFVVKALKLSKQLLPPADVEIPSEALKTNIEMIRRDGIPTMNWVHINIIEDAGIQVADDPFWKDIQDYDVVCMYFHFIYGLLMARSISGSFSHNDVSERNLTLAKTPKGLKTFFVKDIKFELDSSFQIHLIDYDRATWPGHVRSYDLDNGLTIISKQGSGLNKNVKNFLNWFTEPVWRNTKEQAAYASETEALERILLKHPLFEVLRATKRQKKIQTCIQCHRVARYQTATKPTKYFCENKCNQQYHFY